MHKFLAIGGSFKDAQEAVKIREPKDYLKMIDQFYEDNQEVFAKEHTYPENDYEPSQLKKYERVFQIGNCIIADKADEQDELLADGHWEQQSSDQDKKSIQDKEERPMTPAADITQEYNFKSTKPRRHSRSKSYAGWKNDSLIEAKPEEKKEK